MSYIDTHWDYPDGDIDRRIEGIAWELDDCEDWRDDEEEDEDDEI